MFDVSAVRPIDAAPTRFIRSSCLERSTCSASPQILDGGDAGGVPRLWPET